MDQFIQNLVTTTPPAEEPVSLAVAKTHLRVTISQDDTLIAAYISAARELCETITKRAFVTRAYELRMNRFPPVYPMSYLPAYSDERKPGGTSGMILVPKPPLVAVDSITYIDNGGTTRTLDPSAYLVDGQGVLQGSITPAFGTYWPQTRYQLDAVRIAYRAGFGAASAVPPSVVAAILLTVGNWYRNRESVTQGAMSELPMGARALLSAAKWGMYG